MSFSGPQSNEQVGRVTTCKLCTSKQESRKMLFEKKKKSTAIKYIGERVQHSQFVDSQDVVHITKKSHSKEICLLSFQHFPNVRYFEICFSIEDVSY